MYNIFVDAEIIEHIGTDALHFLCAGDIGCSFQLLNVGIGVWKKQHAATFPLQIFLVETFSGFPQVFGCCKILQLRHESERSRIFNGFLNALILNAYQVHGGVQCPVVFAKKIIAVLELCHHTAVCKGNAGLFSCHKGILEPISSLVPKKLTLRR